ncbi:protein phosphatase 2C domain-containing protein [Candidatus Micrarchaeota archaeon]|nr:protein phosphatase 2C domain-containing protein [Candidatus Micrarchaeota archaeon]
MITRTAIVPTLENNTDRTTRFRSLRPEADFFATLPKNPLEKAQVAAILGSFSVAAAVSPAVVSGRSCQDKGVIFSDAHMTLLAVLDGFGRDGGIFSGLLSSHLMDLAQEHRMELTNFPDPKKLLVTAVARMLSDPDSDLAQVGGTTAMISLLFSDGRFFSASIGDSAHYSLQGGLLQRQMDYFKLWIPDQHSLFYVPANEQTLSIYLGFRKYPGPTITREGIDPNAIDEASGTLNPGDLIILMTDGITKNLHIITNSKSNSPIRLAENPIDISGCSDLAHLIGPVRNPEMIVGTVLADIDTRRLLITGLNLPSVLRISESGAVLAPANDDELMIVLRA